MNENILTLVAIIVKFQNIGFKERSYRTCNARGKIKENKFTQRLKIIILHLKNVLSSPEDTLIDFIESGSGEERNIEARGKH